MQPSDTIFWSPSRDDTFNRLGECKLTKLSCQGEHVDCQKCNIPLLFPKEAVAIIKGEPEPAKGGKCIGKS